MRPWSEGGEKDGTTVAPAGEWSCGEGGHECTSARVSCVCCVGVLCGRVGEGVLPLPAGTLLPGGGGQCHCCRSRWRSLLAGRLLWVAFLASILLGCEAWWGSCHR